jgi:prepilin-type processing-associated H-X9-DG protein/prepilin-type N-terminal cleavage/methylation domain-containing protein
MERVGKLAWIVGRPDIRLSGIKAGENGGGLTSIFKQGARRRGLFSGAFTLIELLVVIACIGILSAVLIPVLIHAKTTALSATCRNNLRQWGVSTHLYVADNSDLLPREGLPNPQDDAGELDSTNKAWYIQLPDMIGLPPYRGVPWRTNASINPAATTWLCPSNVRRCNASAKQNNLFHYCLNEGFDGVGAADNLDSKISSYQFQSAIVWLFDTKNLPAVGVETFVHTNLHNRGANFVFLDGHVQRFSVAAYRDSAGKSITNNPELIWFP